MAVKTNATGLSFCVEDSPGVISGTPNWYNLEPNDISTFGATISTVARDPISEDRMAKKGTITSLDSAVAFGADLTVDSFNQFAEGFVMAQWKTQLTFNPTAVTGTGFTVTADGDLTSGTLVYARDFLNIANNGVHVVGAGSTTTNIAVTGLTSEPAPPTLAEVLVCGVQGTTGDLEINVNGNLISTALDFTTLGLTVGQQMFIGSGVSGSSTRFAIDGNYGMARVRSITAHEIIIDKTDVAFVTDDGAGKTVQVFFGHFIRNVGLNDADFVERTYQFETRYTGLEDAGGEVGYEYSIGNRADNLAITLGLEDKATASFNFIGLDTEVGTKTRKDGNWIDSDLTDSFNTTNDFVRISLKDSSENDLTSYFKSLDITLANNVAPEKVLGTLGAAFMAFGKFDVMGSTQVLFTDLKIAEMVRTNETVSMNFGIRNNDGCLHYDIPSMTLGGGNKNFARNEIVKIDVDGTAYKDDFFGHCLGITYFPYIPASM